MERAVEVLEPLLADEDVMIRSLAAEQLEGLEDPRAREWLGRLAKDADKAVRLAALRSLATGSTASDAPVFLEATADGEYEVATVALNVLAGLPLGPEEISRIDPLLDSDNPYVAISAAHAVLSLGEAAGGGGA
jgi:HEAT repeat protein